MHDGVHREMSVMSRRRRERGRDVRPRAHAHAHTRHHHHHRGRKAHNWAEVCVDNEARAHTCQTAWISPDWPLKASSLCGSGGQEREPGTNGKKVGATGRIPVSTSAAWRPPERRRSAHLTCLRRKSSAVTDFTRKRGGNAAPAILFRTLKNTRFSRLVFGDSVASGGSVLCQLLAGVSFEVLKRKNPIDAPTENYFCVGKFTCQSAVTADAGSVAAEKRHQLGEEFTPAEASTLHQIHNGIEPETMFGNRC